MSVIEFSEQLIPQEGINNVSKPTVSATATTAASSGQW